DSALMVIDGAKGIEPQTRKLMEICRDRKIPVITFINKFDRECRTPFELLDEIEGDLGLKPKPRSLPISSGKSYRGAYHLHNKVFANYEAGKQEGEEFVSTDRLEDPRWSEWVGDELHHTLLENAELAEGVYGSFDREDYLNGNSTPVFFGSALNSSGVQMMLDEFTESAPAPLPRFSSERLVEPQEKDF